MRILQIDTRPDWRGGQNQILLLMRGLRERGHEVQLLARRDSPLAARAAAENFSVHWFKGSFAPWRAALCLREILGQQKFEIVHAHDPHALTAAWLARAHKKAATVVARRVAYRLRRTWPGLTRYRKAKRIIAVSQFVARSVIESGIVPERVSVVYDGVEIPPETSPEQRSAARAKWGIDDSTKLLGCVGYLLPEKGQEQLVRALALIHKEFPQSKLLLAGDGPCRSELGRLARELRISSSIVFCGFVENIEEVYRALDTFVFPSLAEPLGSSLLSAMAHALPVIAVASGGVPEVIENGRNGFLATTAKAEQLAAAIQAALACPQESREAAQNARETIISRFSAQNLGESTLAIYENILAGG